MKYADKIDARYSIVFGRQRNRAEHSQGQEYGTGETAEVTLDGHFMEKFIEIQLSDEQKTSNKRKFSGRSGIVRWPTDSYKGAYTMAEFMTGMKRTDY